MMPFDIQQLVAETDPGVGSAPRSAPTLDKLLAKTKRGIEVVVEYQFFRPRPRKTEPTDVDYESNCVQCAKRKSSSVSPISDVETFQCVVRESEKVLKPCMNKLLLNCHVGIQECFTLAQEDCIHKLNCLENPSYPFVVCHLLVKELKPILPTPQLKDSRTSTVFSSVMEECMSLKEEGNAAYKGQEYHQAISCYRDALSSLAKAGKKRLSDDHMAELEQAVFIPVYLNLAACSLKLEAFNTAVRYCSKVIARAPQNAKAQYRMAEAFIRLKELDKANEHISTLVSLNCNPSSVKSLRDARAAKQLQVEEENKALAEKFVNG